MLPTLKVERGRELGTHHDNGHCQEDKSRHRHPRASVVGRDFLERRKKDLWHCKNEKSPKDESWERKTR